ncbi:MAG: Gfo/Idh/MocA family oxidoreductase [Planctomycetes bacterium]|nr:Gfo/Idh/MocA family oxidoreductase [Planctomycetota bacterium]
MLAASQIGVGVIGLGMGSSLFLAHGVPQCSMRVTAVCDTDARRLVAAEQAHQVAATTDYRDLLRRDDIDVIGVFSPDHLHVEHVLAALDAGKHVVCTKPMATSLAGARAILDRVRATGLKFLIGQTCRFIEPYATAKALVDAGRYGHLLHVDACYHHDMRPVFDKTAWRLEAPQDLLFGGLCHPLDLAMWIGGRIDEVSAMSSASGIDPRYPSGLADNFAVTLRFASGALGRVSGLYGIVHADGAPYIQLSLSGTAAASHEGSITWEASRADGSREPRRVEELSRHRAVVHEGVDYTGHGGEVIRYLLHLEDCIRHDREPTPGALEGTRVIAALEAVRESAATGRSVRVAWDF